MSTAPPVADGNIVQVPFEPDRKPFTAYGAAKELWACRASEILLDGPAGTGKTRAILEKVNFIMLKYSRSRALLVRKTREAMSQTVLFTFEEKVLPEGSPIREGPQRNLRTTYNYPNGSQIVVGGMDNPLKVMSSEYDVIATFESTELTQEDFEALTSRLRNNKVPYQQIIADCNPGPPQHWLNARFNKPAIVPITRKRLLSRHRDNPFLMDQRTREWTKEGQEYLGRLKNLGGHRYTRLFEGKWVASDGLVYDEFDYAIHAKDEMPKGWESWRKIRSIDFGFNNPFVTQWWAISPDNEMWMYREIYMSSRIVEDHAKQIVELSEGESYEATVADHDREDRETLERHGVITTPAWKDGIRPGVDAVIARLRLGKNGLPRLFLLRNTLVERDDVLVDANNVPICTLAEFDGYVYAKTQEGKPIKEEPKDKDNHGMDAMRYAVAYVDDLSAQWIRGITSEQSVIVR